jgi:hypothetical protein
MLLSFRFANHRSFRDEQQLNLTPVYPADAEPSAEDEAVRVAGIFGANASGKSNLLHALAFMRQFAIASDRDVEPGLGLSRHPFRLDAEYASAPSRYVVDLRLSGVRHTYGFTIDDDRVLEEWLYHYPLKKKRRIFERDGDAFSWGEESGRRGDLERIAEITAPTALFLSTSARFTHGFPFDHDTGLNDPLLTTYLWFRALHTRTRPDAWPHLAMARAWPDQRSEQNLLVELLRAADLGIEDATVEEYAIDAFTTEPEGPDVAVEATPLRRVKRKGHRLRFTHKGSGTKAVLDLTDESTGTQQLLNLAMAAVVALRNGRMMTVDEIDASLHPMLTAKLIGLFQSSATNPHGSQLVFTSHDATLLGTFDAEEVLRRDQVWFTEKDDEGASILYPLTDFKPRRTGENRPRRYLNGNYGGIPDLSSDLFEQALIGRGELDDPAAN